MGKGDTDFQAAVKMQDINTGDKATALVYCVTHPLLPKTKRVRYWAHFGRMRPKPFGWCDKFVIEISGKDITIRKKTPATNLSH